MLLLALSVAGCSGSDEDAGDDGGGEVPARGRLLQNPPELVATVSAASLLVDLGTPENFALLAHAGSPVCDIAVYRIAYTTVGGANEDTTATGALMVPTGGDARCQGPRPVVLYAHGTTTEKPYDITNLDDSENVEGLYLAAFFAAQG